jgi:hypothetical protein
MAVKLTRLTHKIAIQLHLVADSYVPFAVLAPGGQSGNFWVPPRITDSHPSQLWCQVKEHLLYSVPYQTFQSANIQRTKTYVGKFRLRVWVYVEKILPSRGGRPRRARFLSRAAFSLACSCCWRFSLRTLAATCSRCVSCRSLDRESCCARRSASSCEKP